MIKGRAETPEEKRVMIERLYKAWCQRSELRLGQFITNATYNLDDIFYIEDDPLLSLCEVYAQPYRENNNG